MLKNFLYSGKFIPTKGGNSKLVLLSKDGSSNPSFCLYMTNDFGHICKHRKRGYANLSPSIEWDWAANNWEDQEAPMTSEEVAKALETIRLKRHLELKTEFKATIPAKNGPFESSPQSKLAVKISNHVPVEIPSAH